MDCSIRDPKTVLSEVGPAVPASRLNRIHLAAAGREVLFKTSLQLTGSEEISLPAHIFLEIDGRPAGELKLPGAVLDKGQVPLSFKHRFPNPGSHLVTVRLSDDALPGDNQRWAAVPVKDSLLIRLVDGEPSSEPFGSEVDYLAAPLSIGMSREAASRRQRHPALVIRRILHKVAGSNP